MLKHDALFVPTVKDAVLIRRLELHARRLAEKSADSQRESEPNKPSATLQPSAPLATQLVNLEMEVGPSIDEGLQDQSRLSIEEVGQEQN